MPLGPVQLLVISFDRPDFRGEVLAELERLREGDVVRVIDLLVVHKSADGVVRSLQHSDLSAGAGAVVGALIGADGDHQSAEEELWSLDEAIPDDSAAAIALVEHRWAIGTRDAIRAAGGVAVADAWVHPADLAGAGLVDARTARPELVRQRDDAEPVAAQGLDDLEEGVEGVRLGDVAVGAEVVGARDVVDDLGVREDDDRHPAHALVARGADGGEDLVAVDAGEVEVEQDEVPVGQAALGEVVEGALAVGVDLQRRRRVDARRTRSASAALRPRSPRPAGRGPRGHAGSRAGPRAMARLHVRVIDAG